MSIDQARDSRANMAGIFSALFSNATVDRDYAPYGLFLLRISLGFDWLVHAFLKISRGMYTHEALLAKNGITPLLAWPTFSLEAGRHSALK
jgi:putative oxidoreductase